MSQNPKVLERQSPKDAAASVKNFSVGKDKKKKKSLIMEKNAETYVTDSMRKPRGTGMKIKGFSVQEKKLPLERKSTYLRTLSSRLGKRENCKQIRIRRRTHAR